MTKAVVFFGAVAIAAAPSAPAGTSGAAPPDDPGVAGIVHCTVPAVRGTQLAAAKRRVSKARCSVYGVMHKRSGVRRGRVVSVVPKAGTVLAEGTGVLLLVSSGR